MGDRLRKARETGRMDAYSLAQEFERRTASAAGAYRFTLSAETVKQIVTALYTHAAVAGGCADNYTIDRWDTRRGCSLDRSFGALSDYDGALAAYRAIAAKYPGDHVTLRNRSRVLASQNAPLTPP